MKIKRIVVGVLSENCYVLTIDNECIVIDPGSEPERIETYIQDKKLVGILITHHHSDHIGALKELLNNHPDVKENVVNSDKFQYEIIENPGHTKDSVSYYFKNEKIMFTGDFIFKGAIGRTDLGGSDESMIKSLKMISEYPDDITIYPGHGFESTLGSEKESFQFYY